MSKEDKDGRNSKLKTTDESKLWNYMHNADLPHWYRGISVFQITAVQNLLFAIRDDTEEKTSHRTRDCLVRIGLLPVPSSRDIKLLIRLCRGNDLAFLWFLMEMRYRTPSKRYTINEQLIMSSITMLDMVTTLRELTRILPPSSMSKKAWEKRQRLANAKPVQKDKNKSSYISPYFEPLERPKYCHEPLFVPRPDFQVRFGVHAMYKDPNYTVPNEFNRWYENYELTPGKRVVHNILKDAVGEMFDDFDMVAERANKIKGICDHHKKMRDMEALLEAELKVLAKQKVLEHMDVDKEEREEREKRITEILENDVREYMEKFRKSAEKTNNQVMIMAIGSKDDCHYHLEDKDSDDCGRKHPEEEGEEEEEEEPEDKMLPTASKVGVKSADKSAKTRQSAAAAQKPGGRKSQMSMKAVESKSSTFTKPPIDNTNKIDKKETHKTETKSMESKSATSTKIPLQHIKTESLENMHKYEKKETHKSETKRRSETKETHKKPHGGSRISREDAHSDDLEVSPSVERHSKVRISLVDVDYMDKGCEKFERYGTLENICGNALSTQHESELSDTFFKPNYEHQPHVFDYPKIFKFNTDKTEKGVIKKAVFEALESKLKFPEGVPTSKVDLNEPVDKCVKRMWFDGVRTKNAQLEALAKAKAEQDEHDIKMHGVVLRYDIEYYDPSDREFMMQMLKDAFTLLKKNPKFVLASMPEAHKLPILLEWIRCRYGWKYKNEDLRKSFRYHLKIFRLLEKQSLLVHLPDGRDLGEHLVVDYSCRDYALKKAQMMKKKYYDTFDRCILKHARTFWCAIRPYQCIQGPPRSTYFAYMPSCPREIQHNRIWQLSEFRDAKLQWERRRREERSRQV